MTGMLFNTYMLPVYPLAWVVLLPIVVLLYVTGILINTKYNNNLKNKFWDILPLLKIFTGHPVLPHPT
jgi:hypothetical protein